jgi:hypothetical protein
VLTRISHDQLADTLDIGEDGILVVNAQQEIVLLIGKYSLAEGIGSKGEKATALAVGPPAE